MRIILLALICFSLGFSSTAQTEGQEEVLQIAEEMPRFPGCEDLSELAEKKDCAGRKMLEFIYQNVQYPDSARINGIEGTVVVRFVVTSEGTLRDATIIRDIGGGCGEEALRVVGLMQQLPDKWIPGKQNGEAVSVYFVLPVKFRLEKPAPPTQPAEFVLVGKDTVWTVVDTPIEFAGEEGQELEDYVRQTLRYPKEGLADCKVGEIEVEILIARNGRPILIDMADYSGLDIDFQYEVVAWISRSAGKWKPATRDGQPVHSSFWYRLYFAPDQDSCAERVADFEQAKQWVEEGLQLMADTSQTDAAFARLDQAIELFPNNTEMLAVRGQAYMEVGNFEKACADIKKASGIMWSDWLNSLKGMLCK